MKKLNSLLLMLSLMVVALGINACSSNGDGDDDGVVGTWFGYSCGDGGVDDLSTNHTLTIVFKADGTGTFDEYETIDSNKCSFTYSMEGTTKGKAYISSRGTTIYFVIESGKMYIYGHGYGKDLDYLLTKQ